MTIVSNALTKISKFQVDYWWSTWNFHWSTESSRTKIEHALEFTDLCAIKFLLVVHEVSA